MLPLLGLLRSQRRELELHRARRDALATDMGRAAALAAARLDRDQLQELAARSRSGRPLLPAGQTWGPLLRALAPGGAR